LQGKGNTIFIKSKMIDRN